MLITGTGVNDVVFASGSFKSVKMWNRGVKTLVVKTIATLSLGLWTGVICGRLIAYL